MSDLPFGPPVRVSPLIRTRALALVVEPFRMASTLSQGRVLHRVLSSTDRVLFGRWSFLTAGILYGAFHQNRLSKKEEKFREIEAKEKVIRDAKLKAEKALAAAAEIKALEEMVAPKK